MRAEGVRDGDEDVVDCGRRVAFDVGGVDADGVGEGERGWGRQVRQD